MLRQIQDRYTPAILAEALRRFGFDDSPLEELEGSAFVYEGRRDGAARIVKIVPGIWNTPEQLMGSTREQLLGEVEFVRYLAENGLPVSLPVRSLTGEWVEVIPVDERACFLAYCFEKAPGILLPDADEVAFPESLLRAWGRLCGHLHRLSSRYRPDPAHRRVPWHANDLLDFASLIPPDQPLVHHRRGVLIERLHALPQHADCYGLIHGDLHHGNFLVDGDALTLFDFDAATEFWYIGEVCTALYNCLPLPRSRTAKRREFALHFLDRFLRGYRQEKPLDVFWVAQIPLFLSFCDLLTYAYFHKYWELNALSERRRGLLDELRGRIEVGAPVVAFLPGDLTAL